VRMDVLGGGEGRRKGRRHHARARRHY
jgi:hypothetical protein